MSSVYLFTFIFLIFIFIFIFRQTMVLVFYLLCIILLMTFRPFLNMKFLKNGKISVYNALYFIPLLALFHTVIGGLICKKITSPDFSMYLFICLIFRLFFSIFEYCYINDLKCCPFFNEIGSKYEVFI